ncbi:hypothetical protein CDAR_235751 [Caerostris darwini]|uniref:Uncharacterized protein n=1 Tax=Caerostris darwini TaxID=1538125 RepID=A0AAV4SV10_9ARAC|nr:hypothetical protein CDAR_235751 [Caerostris darwini]
MLTCEGLERNEGSRVSKRDRSLMEPSKGGVSKASSYIKTARINKCPLEFAVLIDTESDSVICRNHVAKTQLQTFMFQICLKCGENHYVKYCSIKERIEILPASIAYKVVTSLYEGAVLNFRIQGSSPISHC